MNKFLTTLFLCFIGVAGFSQGLTMYQATIVPQSMRTNPALVFPGKFHLGLPIVSQFNLSLVNNGFVFGSLFETVGDKLTVTEDEMLSGIGDNNYMSLGLDIDYLSFGFKVKEKNYFSLNVTERIEFNFDYSKDFMTMLGKGTAADEFLGESIDITGTGFRFSHYREYGIGYSRIVNEKLTIGTRVKLLQGLSHLNSEQTDIQLTTAEDDWDITATASIGVRTAGLGAVTDSTREFSNEIGSYLSNFGNLGIGIDLGANYAINDKISVSASVVDLGVIKWKTDARRYYNNKASFTWDGLDVIDYLDKDSVQQEEFVSNLADSIQNIFGLQKDDAEYSTSIASNLYLGGNYQFNKHFNAGVLFHGEIFKGALHPSFTLYGGAKAGRWLHANLSYSILNRSYDNIGGSVAFNLGAFQLYMASDNLYGLTRVDYAKNLNMRFGVNVITGYYEKLSKEQRKAEKMKRELKKKDTDKDGVNDYDDKCVDTPGPKELGGCPDKDNDGVADIEDECPMLAGFIETNGCPDKDNDGTADKDDQCPDLYGTLKGCPDGDEDGIADTDDQCPDKAGPESTGGCPDRDGDGVADKDDKCPKVAGDPAHGGCPDSDGDGVFDDEDKCPDEKGSPEFKGCTNKDTDRDGIPDVNDKCPYRGGPKETNGCP